MKKTFTLPFMLLGILFCICLITSNLLSTKILQIGWMNITAGIMVFPISYIINDCIVEVWGYRKARLIIWVGFIANFFVLAFAKVAALLPSPEYWEGEESFNFIFNLAPRIAIASFSAFLAGSFLNAYVMSRMKVMAKGKRFYVRALVSTLAGETVDSLVFFPIALLGLIEVKYIILTMVSELCLKFLYEIVALPVTIPFVKYLKKVENTDTFDNDISYNVLKVNDM